MIDTKVIEITILVLPMRKLMFKQLLPKVIDGWETDLGIDTIFDCKACRIVGHGHSIQPLGLANFLDFTTLYPAL